MWWRRDREGRERARDDLVELRRYSSLVPAQIAAGRLRSLGLRVIVLGSGVESLTAPYNLLDGVRLMVHAEDFDEAVQTLVDIESDYGDE